MKVAISGSSGFVGKHLSFFLQEKGFEVVPLPHVLFDSSKNTELNNALSGCNIVINLAGTTINHRWTRKYKNEIFDSRINTTRVLVNAINRMVVKPAVFISVSAVGIYPSKGVYTEGSAEYGIGFLSQVCIHWELEARRVLPEVRLVIPRFGVVLSQDGGALPKMILPFRLFMGGRIASGNQGFSWIHMDDLLEAFYFILQTPSLSGVFNFTSPDVLTNRKFAHLVSRELERPDWLPIPTFVFRLLYGEGYVLMTSGQQAYPSRLVNAGYKFKYDRLYLAIQDLYS